MRHEKERFSSDLLKKVPQLESHMQEVEKVEFGDEIDKLNKLILHMFRNAHSTNASLNRVIVYTLFNCICKTAQAKRGFIILLNEGLFSSAFLLNRSIFELWAAAAFVEKTIRDFRASRDEEKFAKIAGKLFAGARYPVELPWGEPSSERPVHINAMLAELEHRYPTIGDTYSFLCEYCHPNFLYNMEAYLASSLETMWENPLFAKRITKAIERQLSILADAIRGIKAYSNEIVDMCLEEYGLT